MAEVRKRGSDFWGEFEFYLSDLVVGCVLDCVLVSLLAPIAVLGPHAKSRGKGGECSTPAQLTGELVLCGLVHAPCPLNRTPYPRMVTTLQQP